MSSDCPDFFINASEWAASSPQRSATTPQPDITTGYDHAVNILPASGVNYQPNSIFAHAKQAGAHGCACTHGSGEGTDVSFNDFAMGQVSAPLHFALPPLLTSQVFAPPVSPTSSSQATSTVSPLDTRFDRDGLSYTPETSLSVDGHSARTLPFQSWEDAIHSPQPLTKRRNNSTGTDMADRRESVSSTTSRRRKSENVEPGSARAIYLEKNRKAASKCRTKQKKQQEELVETARTVERKNKALKAEVDCLKGDIRELMELVGRHTECPDTRLKTYVQREADRIACGAPKSPSRPACGLPERAPERITRKSVRGLAA